MIGPHVVCCCLAGLIYSYLFVTVVDFGFHGCHVVVEIHGRTLRTPDTLDSCCIPGPYRCAGFWIPTQPPRCWTPQTGPVTLLVVTVPVLPRYTFPLVTVVAVVVWLIYDLLPSLYPPPLFPLLIGWICS